MCHRLMLIETLAPNLRGRYINFFTIVIRHVNILLIIHSEKALV